MNFIRCSWHVGGMKRLVNKQYFGGHILIDISNTWKYDNKHYIIYYFARPNISFSSHITVRILVFWLNSSVMAYTYVCFYRQRGCWVIFAPGYRYSNYPWCISICVSTYITKVNCITIICLAIIRSGYNTLLFLIIFIYL